MSSAVNLDARKQSLTKLLVPFLAGKLPLCLFEKRLGETLEKCFHSIVENEELKDSLLAKDLKKFQLMVEAEKRNPAREKISAYYMTWAKFFNDVKRLGFHNSCNEAKAYAALYEQKIKDHATLAMWSRLSKFFKGAPIFKSVDAIRTWMSESDVVNVLQDASDVELSGNSKFLKSITYLNLEKLDLRIIPEEIKWLPNLEYLILSDNKIQILPAKFEGGGKLKYLYLYNNLLRSIPDEFQGLPYLEMLALASNKITLIPVHLIGLPSLKALNVNDNPVSSFPKSFKGLPNLQYFSCNGMTHEYSSCEVM